MNSQKIESFDVMSRKPKFYQQVSISYNSCKLIKPVNKMKDIKMLFQPILGNEITSNQKINVFSLKVG